MKFLGAISVGFTVTGQLLIRFYALIRYHRKLEHNGTVHQLFIAFKKAYATVRKVLYDILIEFGVSMKLVWLIKMSLNETYCIVRTDKHLSYSFPIKNGLKQEDPLSPLLFQLCFRICH
jgi:hypothetical protein